MPNFRPMKRSLLILSLLSFSLLAAAQRISKLKITDVEKMMAKNDSILVINFWATFCKPCVAEIPEFIRIVKKYEGQKVKLILVSLDLPDYYPAKISDFVKKRQFNTNIAWLNETNADYFCPKISTKWSGAIPATIIVNTRTGYKQFFEEELTAAQFEVALKLAIARSKDIFLDPPASKAPQ